MPPPSAGYHSGSLFPLRLHGIRTAGVVVRLHHLFKEEQMRTSIKVIIASIVVAFTLLLPFAGMSSAETWVSKKACEANGGLASGGVCRGGKYDGLPIMN